MINSVKSFFKLIGFEIKKLVKSPLVFGFLVLAPFVMSFAYCAITKTTNSDASLGKDVVFVCDDIDNPPDVSELVNGIWGENTQIEWHSNLEEMVIELKLSNINLIIYCNSKDNNSLNVIYDEGNNLSIAYKDNIVLAGYKYSYHTIKDVLSEFGVYIEDIALKLDSVGEYNGLKYIEPIAFAMIISFLLIVGISYTMARDNETGVIKQLGYTPISINKYLMVRWVFFVLLGTIQSAVVILTFSAFGVSQLHYIAGLMGLSLLFNVAFSSLGLLLSTAKNQISAISMAIMFIILPVITQFVGMNTFNTLIKVILYISPVTPFLLAFTPYLKFGLLNPTNIIILIIHTAVYCALAIFILNKKAGRTFKRKKRL